MSIMMPEADQAVLARRDEIVAALQKTVPGEGVISSAREMQPYESDALTAYRQPPMVVVLPDTTEQVSQVLKYCHDNDIIHRDITPYCALLAKQRTRCTLGDKLGKERYKEKDQD